jgi:small subunit ribosomal protein S16
MARTGRTNRPFFRLGAFDSRTRRDGTPIEYLGHYDPLLQDFEKSVVIDLDRARHWISKGAKCSETVASFLKRKGVELPRNILKNGNRTKGKTKGAKAALAAKAGAKPSRAKAARAKPAGK